MPRGIYQHKPHSEETKRKISMNLKRGFVNGRKPTSYWLGKKQTKGIVKKRVESRQKYLKEHPEYLQRFSQIMRENYHNGLVTVKGKHWKKTKEQIRKRSESLKGNKYALGKHWKLSEEDKKKMRERRLKQIFPFKDTSIEIKLQNWLKKQGIEFETHHPILGQPDIFIKPNICIFADGCYWHKCPQCGFGELRQRDLQITQELQKQGYMVFRLWEHEINNNEFEKISLT
jgi:DNA mismatch endonuclease (patch repair protein)